MSDYTLPELPYDYAALEPHISGKIMQLHHDKHHQAYVTGANTALEKLAEARESGDLGAVNLHSKNLAFNLGGHVNHTVFWENLSPEGGEPAGELLTALENFFGGVEAFKKHFTAVAAGVQGSGWAVLAWDTLGARPVITQLYDQQGNLAFGLIPLLMLDVWEHAYYLDYLNVRADYIAAWWNIVNWNDVAARLARATTAGTNGLILPA
ncbi:superoxide dismutase [Serinibacter arcticus]|uniref:Superoxide dismutase n=1 Tax=Serinibacter arcticus TaxID=1655435 RepID=A0A2U1ZSA2_9MICO|nr:superoxide dismutase [Serinibacter arcticus]PWD49856.1 superoxide dismutase [Serinibacter arcticus]